MASGLGLSPQWGATAPETKVREQNGIICLLLLAVLWSYSIMHEVTQALGISAVCMVETRCVSRKRLAFADNQPWATFLMKPFFFFPSNNSTFRVQGLQTSWPAEEAVHTQCVSPQELSKYVTESFKYLIPNSHFGFPKAWGSRLYGCRLPCVVLCLRTSYYRPFLYLCRLERFPCTGMWLLPHGGGDKCLQVNLKYNPCVHVRLNCSVKCLCWQ